MARTSWAHRHATSVWAGAVLLGPVVAALLTLARGTLEPGPVSLVLVLVVIGVSAVGLRPAGVVAAVTTGLAFDFFWTQPYYSLAVFDGDDLATVLLLIGVGVAVEQGTWWARRRQAEADRSTGYLDALRHASVPAFDQPGRRLDDVCAALVGLLDADRCAFTVGSGAGKTVLGADGRVVRDGRAVAVDRDGLPTDDLISIAVVLPSGEPARFEVAASTHIARSTVEQRQLAVLLAGLAAAHAGVGLPADGSDQEAGRTSPRS